MFISIVNPIYAQEGIVSKAANNKALVVFPVGTKLNAGEKVVVGGEPSALRRVSAPRDYSLSFSTNLISHTSVSMDGASFTTTGFGNAGMDGFFSAEPTQFRFGWNKGSMEFGPTVSYQSYAISEQIASVRAQANISSFFYGGFFDYDLIPNTSGRGLVYGISTDLQLGNTSLTGGSSGFSISATRLFLGGFAKWFPLGGIVAIRGDAGLDYERQTLTAGNSSVSGTATSVLLKGGAEVYF